ncbi:MAG TPA: hypothetical protein VKE96_01900 [Vicinamibacterales bacterium]|nr:hypothetical protein [Vicinamibacterales bacterium]
MKRTIKTSLYAAIAACATVAVTAQTPASQPPTSQPPTSQPPTAQPPTAQPPASQPPAPQTPAPQTTAPSSEKTVTIIGCLKEAPSSGAPSSTAAAPTTPPPASAGDTGAGPNYILTNATTSTGSAGTTGTTGTTPGTTAGTTGSTTDTKSSSGSGQTYKLVANPTALTPHVGKKLELTGTLEGPGSAAPTSTTGSGANALMNAPTLRVTGGKIIAPSCEE